MTRLKTGEQFVKHGKELLGDLLDPHRPNALRTPTGLRRRNVYTDSIRFAPFAFPPCDLCR